MGGTEIWQPLDHIFRNKGSSDLQRHVYLLTDGCVSNTDEVVSLISKNSNEFSLHAFGIGGGVSTDLII